MPKPTPRFLLDVIIEMIASIPSDQTELIAALDSKFDENLWKAPEVSDWSGVATVLQDHLERRDYPWADEVLKIWRNES